MKECKTCGQISRSQPAGLGSIIKVVGRGVADFVSPSTVRRTASNIPTSTVTRTIPTPRTGGSVTSRFVQSAPDVVHSGTTYGTRGLTPSGASRYLDPTALRQQAETAFREGVADTQARIQSVVQASIRQPDIVVPTPPSLQNVPRADILSVVRREADEIANQPIRLDPARAIDEPYLFRPPDVAAQFQGTAAAVRNLADEISATLAREGRSIADNEITALTAAMRELDNAKTVFRNAPGEDAAVLAREISALRQTTILDDPVQAALRQVSGQGDDILRRGDDYGEILSRQDYDNFRVFPGERLGAEDIVVDEFGDLLMRRTINMADNTQTFVYRHLDDAEMDTVLRNMQDPSVIRAADDAAGSVTRQVADDVAGAGGRAADDLTGAGRGGLRSALTDGLSLTKLGVIAGGSAVTGGIIHKMMFGDAGDVPRIGDGLDEYIEAVCNPDSPQYDKASCEMITEIDRLLVTYPESWYDVCIEGSPIFDEQMCSVITGMFAAAEAGVPYAGGGPEYYGGQSGVLDQAQINALVERYCHPASPDYSEEACQKVKDLAAKYGFYVNEPWKRKDSDGDGEPDDPVEEPPWDEMTPEQIRDIVCDPYGPWYSPGLCKEYTEYLRQQSGDDPGGSGGGGSGGGGSGGGGSGGGGSGGGDSGGGDSGGGDSGGGSYVPGSNYYPGAGGFSDGGWYGGGDGGVEYHQPSEEEMYLCALDDETCIGWFQYLNEYFYWDGQEFYDAYGNLVYFVWTEEHQRRFEELLARGTVEGNVTASIML